MESVLIVNPASGQGKAASRKRELLDLVSSMPEIQIRSTSAPDDALHLAREAAESGCERIIAAGGDGTINQIINGIGDRDIALGVVPLGTGNVLARELGMHLLSVPEALAVVQTGRTRLVDVATANGTRFLLMAGFGFDAAVVDSVSPKLKDRAGVFAYGPAIVRQLIKFAPRRFRLAAEDGVLLEVEAFAVIAANCSSYACGVRVAPEASLDDGLLDVVVFEKSPWGKLTFLRQAAKVVWQSHLSERGVTCFRTAALRVESEPECQVQLDGDVWGEGRVDLRVLPNALRLVVRS